MTQVWKVRICGRTVYIIPRDAAPPRVVVLYRRSRLSPISVDVTDAIPATRSEQSLVLDRLAELLLAEGEQDVGGP